MTPSSLSARRQIMAVAMLVLALIGGLVGAMAGSAIERSGC